MRFILTMMLLAAFAVVALTACQNAPTTSQNTGGNTVNKTVANQTQNTAPKVDAHGHEDNAPRISLAEAKKEFDAGNAVFVDTRTEAAFNQERIKGAINIPAEAAATRAGEVPKGKKIIAYCS